MNSDLIVIGSGLAGLTSALLLSQHGEVLLVSKEKLQDSASSLAQGGIAAVVEGTDSFASHIQDTLTAGAGQNDKQAVEFLITHAPQAVAWLEKQGVLFDRTNGTYALGQEAAHSARRILHATDFTGKIIIDTLLQSVKKNSNIRCLENCFFLDLLVQDNRCYGIQIMKNGEISNCYSRATILATGGLGQIYQWTTNPKIATGDGIAAGFRAGTTINDLEFIQFHPTALKYGQSPLFLLSEGIRGEGGVLVNEKGERFMERIHPLMELAPRDILARALFQEQKNSKVFLDIRHKDEKFLRHRFPNIFAYLSGLGLNMSRDLLPVTPAAHYSCGGIKVNLQGQTDITGLFAFGEVSCTGVHGANRLASNSLLEAAVFPLQLPNNLQEIPGIVEERYFPVPDYDPHLDYPHIKKQLQQLMWDHVGIIRTKQGLHKAQNQLMEWKKIFEEQNAVNEEYMQLKNMITTASLVTEMALFREIGLGSHYVVSK